MFCSVFHQLFKMDTNPQILRLALKLYIFVLSVVLKIITEFTGQVRMTGL